MLQLWGLGLEEIESMCPWRPWGRGQGFQVTWNPWPWRKGGRLNGEPQLGNWLGHYHTAGPQAGQSASWCPSFPIWDDNGEDDNGEDNAPGQLQDVIMRLCAENLELQGSTDTSHLLSDKRRQHLSKVICWLSPQAQGEARGVISRFSQEQTEMDKGCGQGLDSALFPKAKAWFSETPLHSFEIPLISENEGKKRSLLGIHTVTGVWSWDWDLYFETRIWRF